MFLCKLRLDPNHPQGRRDLADPYEMHRTLVRAVVPDAGTAPPRLLWRLERAVPGEAVLLVQSPANPSWGKAFEEGALLDARTIQFDPDEAIRQGSRYRFRLLANPTVTRAGKRHGLFLEDEQLAWMQRQGERNGFRVLACVRTTSRRLVTRQRREGGNRMVVQTVGFEGLLEVLDAKAMATAMRNGLGHAKALGLGLFSLARAAA